MCKGLQRGLIRQVWGDFEAKAVFWVCCGGGRLSLSKCDVAEIAALECTSKRGLTPPEPTKDPHWGAYPPSSQTDETISGMKQRDPGLSPLL